MAFRAARRKIRLGNRASGTVAGALFGAAWLCGIGFTMSLFIGTLAFGEGGLLDMSKIGILAASLASGVGAGVFLMRVGKPVAVSRGLNTDRRFMARSIWGPFRIRTTKYVKH
jgi:Na+:H+ antiporter, NhaA family